MLTSMLAAVPALAEQPQKGDLIDSSNEGSFRGWEIYRKAIGVYNQAYVVFKQGDVFLLAATLPEKRSSRGGFEIERLLHTVVVKPSKLETVIDGSDCGFLGLSPAITFFDKKSNIATGYFVLEDEVAKRRWIVDDPELCEEYLGT